MYAASCLTLYSIFTYVILIVILSHASRHTVLPGFASNKLGFNQSMNQSISLLYGWISSSSWRCFRWEMLDVQPQLIYLYFLMSSFDADELSLLAVVLPPRSLYKGQSAPSVERLEKKRPVRELLRKRVPLWSSRPKWPTPFFSLRACLVQPCLQAYSR